MINVTLKQKILLVISGFLLSLIFIEIVFGFGSLAYLYLIERRNRVSLAKGDDARILFLGESTTAEGGWNSYPREVGKILAQKLPDKKIGIINKGVPAVNTSFILSALDENLNEYYPNIVVVMMGINDGAEDEVVPRVSLVRRVLAHSSVYRLLRAAKMKFYEKEILLSLLLSRGNFAAESRNYLKAERMFERAIALAPQEASGYIALGNCYLEENKIGLAIGMFKAALAINPLNTESYISLGNAYKRNSQFFEAERIFKRAADFSDLKQEALTELGWLYYLQGNFPEAEGLFTKLFDAYPDSDDAYLQLAKFYQGRRDYLLSCKILQKAIALFPKNEQVYLELARLYDLEARFFEEEEVLKKGIELNPYIEELYLELQGYYKKRNNLLEEEKIRKKVDSTVWNYYYYHQITIANYRALKEEVLRKGIKLVCVQYPRRSVAPLKEILAPIGGIIFVDNQKIFADAIGTIGYDELFIDRFAGDFGHCTPLGNRLLASNVAETLLKEIFLK